MQVICFISIILNWQSKKNFEIYKGTLIYENIVLTAAHCVNNFAANELAVLIGVNNIKNELPTKLNTYFIKNR